MSEVVISIDQIRNIINQIESEDVKVFDESKINAFVEEVKLSNTIYKLTKSVSADMLEELLELMDIYFNSQKVTDKVKNIFNSIESNYCMDYFSTMLENLEYTYE